METYMHQRVHIHRTGKRERERERARFYLFSSMSQTKEKGNSRNLSVVSTVIKLPFCWKFYVFLNSSLRELFIKFETRFIDGNTASAQKLHRVKEWKYMFPCVVVVLGEIWCSYCSLMKIQEVFYDFLDIKDEDGKLIRNVRNFTSQNTIIPQKT
jgi:hypothetical protein